MPTPAARSLAVLAAIRKLERRGHSTVNKAIADTLESAGAQPARIMGKYSPGGSMFTRLNIMLRDGLVSCVANQWHTTPRGRTLLSQWREIFVQLEIIGGRRNA